MPYPNFAGKHEHPAFVTPELLHRYRVEHGQVPDRPFPESVILTYQRQLWTAAQRLEATTPFGGQAHFAKLHLLDRTDGRVGVTGDFGIGAPIASVIVEELAAAGVRRFISMGTAGGLQPSSQAGDVVLCERAVRDEGVSHHYLPPATYATPTPGLTEAFADHLAAAGIEFVRGACWTIDTPYRETVEEARHYQAEGVWCVEMEAAALFAVAEHRGLEIASAFCISDSLADLEWVPQFHDPRLATSIWAVFQAAVDTLAAA